MTGETTKLELSNDEVHYFLTFRKHQDIIMRIIESGILNIRNGQAVMSFNNDGVLQEIKITIVAYRRAHEKFNNKSQDGRTVEN
jgi:hypothetical protein